MAQPPRHGVQGPPRFEFAAAGFVPQVMEVQVDLVQPRAVLWGHAPSVAYREEGVQGVIPPNAVLTAELSVISERAEG